MTTSEIIFGGAFVIQSVFCTLVFANQRSKYLRLYKKNAYLKKFIESKGFKNEESF
jgi:hypothetical protein